MDGTYPPLNTLKPVAEGVWLVDGPIIQFGPRFLKMPFPTRMTIIRLSDGSLFVHSPTPLTDALKKEVEAIGTPRFIVSPTRIHYWWIPEWSAAYPDAQVYLAPRVREQAKDRIVFPTLPLGEADDAAYPWSDELDTLAVRGSYLTEVEFFHRPSKTLILADLIESFEPQKLASWRFRLLSRLGGVRAPGAMPRDMRLTFRKQDLRTAVEAMIAWNPERVIIAHGRWFPEQGAHELARAFDWLLTATR